jgi:hypothetical protein
MSELDDKIHELIDAYKKEVLHKFFPSAKFKEAGSITSNNIPPRTFDAVISNEGLFENTDYKFNPNTQFIHFTSLPSLSQILQSGFLRMSDFNCLSDKSELLFGSNVFSDCDNDKIKEAKANIFSLSACLSDRETLNNQHMWNKYACKGMGCAIEYKFISTNIHDMVFGKILYGKRDLKNLRKLKKLNEKFKKDYYFEIADLPMLLLKASAFHKQCKFKSEKEVRLLFYNETTGPNYFIHRNHYKDFNSDQKVRNFIKLYIKGKNPNLPASHPKYENDLIYEPEIEISRVIIGPNCCDILNTAEHIKQKQTTLNINFDIWYKNQTGAVIKLDF